MVERETFAVSLFRTFSEEGSHFILLSFLLCFCSLVVFSPTLSHVTSFHNHFLFHVFTIPHSSSLPLFSFSLSLSRFSFFLSFLRGVEESDCCQKFFLKSLSDERRGVHASSLFLSFFLYFSLSFLEIKIFCV